MSKIYFFKKKLFALLIIIAGLSLSVKAAANSKQVPDSVLTKLVQYPESISSYSLEELTRNMDQKRISQWCNILCSMNPNSINRNIIKCHYFPLCRSVIEIYSRESEILQEIANNRTFPTESIYAADSISTGRDIICRFMEYQRVCMAMKELPLERIITPIFYGDMRMIESFIWGDNIYMDTIDPVPNKLITHINKLFDVKISSLEKELYGILLKRSNDSNFLIDNSYLLLNASTYLSQSQMGLVVGTVSAAYINQDKKQELFDLFNTVFSKRLGNELWHKLKPIITYQFSGMLEVEKVKDFQHCRDSLLSQHVKFAQYYPYKCPDNLRQNVAYKEYNDKFYNAIDYIFTAFIKKHSVSQYPLNSTIFNIFGCGSQEDFLRIYTTETLKRYYDDNNFLMWGKIEGIREYMESASKYPVDVALHILECYGPINAPKAVSFIRKTSLTSWTDLQMMAPQQNINELGLIAASVLAYSFASAYNEALYPEILKYVEWVEKNIGQAEVDKDGIIYNIASALSLMEKNHESNVWISKVQVDKSEYKQEFYRLLLENHCEIGNTKEAIKVASKKDGFSYQNIVRLLIAKMREGNEKGLGELLAVFTSSLSDDFNLFSFMNSEDQDWASFVAKHQMRNLWQDMDISLWLKKEEDGKQTLSPYEPYIAAMRYNWALASKGALLRSNKFMRDIFLNNMPSEQYQYYRQALDFEEENYQEFSLKSRLDSYVSEQAKMILLDYVRKDTTLTLPQFDYNIVRNQLQTEDIAIELVRSDGNSFDVTMIRKDWGFPKFVSLYRSEKEDRSHQLWQTLMPYLTDVHRIYIALDGEYNFENIELFTDSMGICMADKYNIYRVSTTLNIPKDVYMSDIKQSVLYGNLNYADPNDSSSEGENENIILDENKKRGAINDVWIQLEDTKKELAAISKVLTAMNIPYKEFQGECGDKMSFIALNRRKIDLLHLATHGFYNAEDMSDEDEIPAMKRSGIVLANSAYDLSYTKRSGTIFANEIANMDLNSVKLLVLSACETAQGDLGDDGVFGLQRGFKQAGAGCIIMSLREVNSIMTTELMQSFYSFFAKGQSVREAFRNAQRQISARYKTDDWKSFIIID